MATTTRFDSLLVLHLAGELSERLGGRKLGYAAFDRDLYRLTLGFEGEALHWDLRSGLPHFGAAQPPGQTLILPKRALIAEVAALPDERILRIELSGGQRTNAVRSFLIELLPVARNVVALDQEDRVLKTLISDPTQRKQVRGQRYAAPELRGRTGLDGISVGEWLGLFADVPPGDWSSHYAQSIAFASPINAVGVFSDAGSLEEAYARYIALRSAEPGAYILAEPAGQPYSHPLWQVGAQGADSLLSALAPEKTAELDVAARIAHDLQRTEKKLERLNRELNEAESAALTLRGDADLLMAQAYAIPRGAAEIELADFDGSTRKLTLDPSRSAIQNAQSWYESARKRAKAGERVPALVSKAEVELATLQVLLERARSGEAIEHRPVPTGRKARPSAGEAPALPYRRYRTSGGLEVRVGRSGAANDRLTFKHSSPDDIWLHARQVGGAHVILRWQGTEKPPKSDLVEAAVLAAVHSKARHSGTVPVDFTRRKYVRKPRGAPPGQVRVERAETLFVEPDGSVEERLRIN